MNKRYKLAFEVYGNEEAMKHLKKQFMNFMLKMNLFDYEYDNVSISLNECNFNPEEFFKDLKDLEKRYYERSKA